MKSSGNNSVTDDSKVKKANVVNLEVENLCKLST